MVNSGATTLNNTDYANGWIMVTDSPSSTASLGLTGTAEEVIKSNVQEREAAK